MKAIWKGAVLAHGDYTIEVQGIHYYPLEAVQQQHVRQSDTRTTCHWKGVGSYYHAEVDGETNCDVVRYYPQSKPTAKQIKDHIAFWRGIKVEE